MEKQPFACYCQGRTERSEWPDAIVHTGIATQPAFADSKHKKTYREVEAAKKNCYMKLT